MSFGPCYTCIFKGNEGKDLRGPIVFCLHPSDYTIHDPKLGCYKHQSN
jgi:hypothetical protein